MTRSARQRAGDPCDDGDGAGGADLRAGAGAAAGRGGPETLSRISCSVACSLAISSVICCWAAASCSTLCRTAARPSDIALSCCTSGGGRSRRDHVGSGLRNSLRCQPAKLRGRARDHLSGCIAVGLPNQSGSNTNAKYDQEARKTARGSFVERRLLDPSVGRTNPRLDRRLGGPPIFRKLRLCRPKRVSHQLPPPDCLRATGHRPVTRARREESRRAAEIGEACERTEVSPYVTDGG
jgi:hypothetical protein